jgi:hypothetical protein
VLHVGDAEWASSGAGSYAAWYTNAEHHVAEVQSGHRVVAVYNLLRGDGSETPTPPLEMKESVKSLVTMLQENAAEYLSSFPTMDAQHINSLFEAYSAKRACEVQSGRSEADRPTDYESGCDADFEVEGHEENVMLNDGCIWVRDISSWGPDESIPQEFVGFWLSRQYASIDGQVPITHLGGGDADLAEAIVHAFGVQGGLRHVECRVVYSYDDADKGSAPPHLVYADSGAFVSNDWKSPLRFGVRGEHYDESRCEYLWGDEYRRVAIVGGDRVCMQSVVGLSIGNDAGDPMYRYKETYVYFHVKYLKDYVAGKVGDKSSAQNAEGV